MRLVIDTNRIIAALIRDSTTRRIIISSGIRFITIGLSLEEIGKYKEEILEKTGNSEKELNHVLSLLLEKIEIVDDVVIKNKMTQAKEIMDKIDKDDTKFIALALATENNGIWSDDRHFRMQKTIPLFTTKILVRFLTE
ncbi:MAG: PIN domain-containing protein [Candidatus Marsarchaeota archaeon]|nr:PIN domain-containing protein [Candidatus Marsarchaeota archaeon]MCL5111755.1 PIN domain-containing protein [Candidatus Marsarchaeota archaeon]